MLLKTGIGLLTLSFSALAKQIPIVDGVIGGVPSEETIQRLKVGTMANVVPPKSFATTPGALRVVENSGVCGEHGSLNPKCDRLTMSFRDNTWRFPSIWVSQPSFSRIPTNPTVSLF